MGGPKMRVQSEAGELSRVGSHEASGLEAGCSSPGRQDGVPDGLDGGRFLQQKWRTWGVMAEAGMWEASVQA